MKELSYPFDSAYLLKNRRKIKRQLADDGTVRIRKKIAVLGGSTTNDIVSMLEIFLLEQGIECEFYQSEYAKYWEDVMFANEELLQFKPDLIYIHTTARNITDGLATSKVNTPPIYVKSLHHKSSFTNSPVIIAAGFAITGSQQKAITDIPAGIMAAAIKYTGMLLITEVSDT